MVNIKIIIGTDHRGVDLKNQILQHLKNKNILIDELSQLNGEEDDYPDIAYCLSKKVANREYDRGILICGTGIGISIAANKVRGIRCGVCNDVFLAQMAREDNDINILAIGSRILDFDKALQIVDVFLNTDFMGGRHLRRINKIIEIENTEKIGSDK